MKVSKLLNFHTLIIILFMTTPILSLQWVSSNSQHYLKKNNEIFSLTLVKLLQIDGALKNARFHAYAGFMHNQNLSVSKYHTHPFGLHVNAVKYELEIANKQWEIILKHLQPTSQYFDDIQNLKKTFDNYMSTGGYPTLEALEKEKWESIVQIITASIPQYAEFANVIEELKIIITEQAENDYKQSQQELTSLSITLIILYSLSAIIYMVFSIWLKRKIITPLQDNMKIAEKIARGDLTNNNFKKSNDEFGALSQTIETMRQQLSNMINDIVIESEHIDTYSKALKISSQETAESITKQMSDLKIASSSLEQLLVSINNISRNADNTNEKALQSENAALQSKDRVMNTESGIEEVSSRLTETSQQVENLSTQVKEISSITGVIQNVAAQTNLLALNAAIEAARAGEQGRGFAVVADEVRNLAATTTESVDKISSMIADIQKNALQTVESMYESCEVAKKVVGITKEAKDSIHTINKTTSTLKDLVSETTYSLREQRSASDNLSQNVEAVAILSQNNNQSMENVSKMSDDLAKSSQKLKVSVSGFHF